MGHLYSRHPDRRQTAFRIPHTRRGVDVRLRATVYNLQHIGNAIPAVAFDVLARVLRLYFRHVTYVRNITDIDDKINAASFANGEPIRPLADRFADEYRSDIAASAYSNPTSSRVRRSISPRSST